MRSLRVSLDGIVALTLFGPGFGSDEQQAPQNTPTIRGPNRLGFLDVTVVDTRKAAGCEGVTKDDFTGTEGKKSQRIFSFEASDPHAFRLLSGPPSHLSV
jgi:hypothetical protein